jgi:DNA-binding CsgD family transcriptional regulator
MTPSAQKFLAQLHGGAKNSAVSTLIPTALTHLCDELQACLQQHSWGMEGDNLCVRYIAQSKQGPILLRGYGIPKNGPSQENRFLVLLEATAAESSVSNGQVGEDYRLTDRQRGIVEGLMRGLSNKEIAAELHISTHTVKEYIRQIMMKVKTTSRTGIVARVAGLTLPRQPGPGSGHSEALARTIQVA